MIRQNKKMLLLTSIITLQRLWMNIRPADYPVQNVLQQRLIPNQKILIKKYLGFFYGSARWFPCLSPL